VTLRFCGELYSSAEVSVGPVDVAFLSFDFSLVPVSGGIIRFEADCLIEVSNCSIQIALFLLDPCSVKIGDSVLRIQPDGLVNISYCAVQVAFLTLDVSPVIVSGGNSTVSTTSEWPAMRTRIPVFISAQEPFLYTVPSVTL
jgi:hypothetical protein